MRRQQHFVLAWLGQLIQANPARLLLAALVCLIAISVAIRSAQLDAELSSWIQRTGRVQAELTFVESHLGEGAGSSGELILQSPREPNANVLSVDALMVHLEALAIATQVSVDLFDMTWSLKELCFTPTLPDFDFDASMILNRMMPCSIKTPLDCFWEGSKLLGPEEPIETPTTMGLSNSKWTSLNPLPLVEAMKRNQPYAAFPYDSLIDWMRRVGMTTGYQYKPCLDPTDPNCPDTAPNKLTGKPPDVGLQLTGGCRGFAANQMHWKEEEIVGGTARNKSGHLVHASGLQSTIQLMGHQDMYEYWRQTDKVNKINGWSVDKAKTVLDLWQHRFKEEVQQFTQTSRASSSYKIHAMTSKSMLEPIEADSLLDLSNFHFCFAIMTALLCILTPSLQDSRSSTEKDSNSPMQNLMNYCSMQLRRISVALICSLFIGLAFTASLGFSSLLNLPFNMATTQLLPPLALYYGFNLFITISNIYSQKLCPSSHQTSITTDCLIDSLQIVVIQSSSYVIAFLVSTIIPVPATRVFAFQAIIFIVLASLVGFLLAPAIFNALLTEEQSMVVLSDHSPDDRSLFNSSHSEKPKTTRTPSPISKFIMRNKGVSAKNTDSNDSIIEEQIFSRIQDDLRNIKADSCSQPTSLSFSAHLDAEGLQTKFYLSTLQHMTSVDNNNSIRVKQPAVLGRSVLNPETKLRNQIHLPDLIADSLSRTAETPLVAEDSAIETEPNESEKPGVDLEANDIPGQEKASQYKGHLEKFAMSKLIQISVCFLALCILATTLLHVSEVKYGLQLRDIVAHGRPEHESFKIQEKNFPVYNVFAITKGNFDYPNNQRLLHQFYEALKRIDGILMDELSMPKFWLIAFRDWLLGLQQKFDHDRSKSLISVDGWTSETSDAAKLAYKLLAQTGRVENPIDKGQVMTNRLVDSNGIINPKAFYYYLTAWVVKDPFTYANSEANFRPEPSIWDHHREDNLKIERARPLTYTQIPFQMNLPASPESLKRISEVRTTSQAFEQFNLPNFPTGVPFIFWDQFTNLDVYLSLSSILGLTSVFILVKLVTSDTKIAAITTISITLTLLELYGCLGYLSIPFNNILAVLFISSIGITTIQTVHFTNRFLKQAGDLSMRTCSTMRTEYRTIISNLILLFICALAFRVSKFDFMIKYSSILFCLVFLNIFNSLFLVPVLLRLFGPDYKPPATETCKRQSIGFSGKTYRLEEKEKCVVYKKKKRKKRGYPRIQSKISLSTISEEAQSEAHIHDLKFDFSVKCY